MKRGNWTDDPCWYVSVIDAGRTALLLGPFNTEAACRQWAYRAPEDGGNPVKCGSLRNLCKMDPWAWFYSYGMVKMQNGHREALLNTRLPEYERDAYSPPIVLSHSGLQEVAS